MMNALAIFLCTFSLTFLTGFQSQNIGGGHKRVSFITSALISLMSLVTVKVIANPTDLFTDIAYIFGGPFGIVASLKLHPVIKNKFPRLFERRNQKAKHERAT